MVFGDASLGKFGLLTALLSLAMTRLFEVFSRICLIGFSGAHFSMRRRWQKKPRRLLMPRHKSPQRSQYSRARRYFEAASAFSRYGFDDIVAIYFSSLFYLSMSRRISYDFSRHFRCEARFADAICASRAKTDIAFSQTFVI